MLWRAEWLLLKISDACVTDIRNLDKSDIRQYNDRKRRLIQLLNKRGECIYGKLEQLKSQYQESKGMWVYRRYGALKAMLKEFIRDKQITRIFIS
jgi:hypothetical protein